MAGVVDLFLRYQRVRRSDSASEPVAYHDILSHPKRVVACLPDDSRIPPMVLPALRLLRESHPDIRILVVAGPSSAASLRRERIADKTLILQRKRGAKQVSEIRRLAREIALLDPRVLLLFDPSGDARLKALALACNAPVRVGFGSGENYPFLNFQIAPPREGTYLADALLGIIGSLTGRFVDFLDDSIRLRVPEPDARKAERLLHFWKPRSDKLLFALQPGAEDGPRRIDLEKHAAVARLLAKAYDSRIMILAPPEEKARADELSAMLTSLEPYRAPVEDFSQAVAFLSRADLLVSPNTSLFHYAVAIGVPVVGLFGEKSEPWWNPPPGVRAAILPIHREITEERFLDAVDSVGCAGGNDES